ncbi:RHS repeat-associated core domain-containing protein [Streptomyces sp. NPDC051555]|uniref:RHS repeat-associated core domain-containing protein n=1 Tax=Streptomyces sp. NPDC051555 TaxID=3365657 RepID=UPI0037A86D12
MTHYAYDRTGSLAEARTATSVLSIERDLVGRVRAETVDGRTIRYAHDKSGRRTGRTTPTGAVSRLAYDTLGHRTSIAVDAHAISFGHDPLGREVTRVGGSPEERVTLTTTWSGTGRPTAQTLAAAVSAEPLRSRTYGYRPDGYPVSVTEHTAGTPLLDRRISLDPVGRPLAVESADWSEAYAYDRAGNQTAASWPPSAGRTDARGQRAYDGTRLLRAGAVHYEHDAAGRVVLRRRTLLSRKPDIWRYAYDAQDRMTSCTTPDGTVWTYAYDPLGRRNAKHRLAADGRTVVESVHYTWDGTLLVEQSDDITGTVLTWEHDGHSPIAQYERKVLDGEEVDARFFAIVTDLAGTPTELVSATGETAWHARATTWGATGWNRDATAYTPLRFPGQYADPETGLHYNFFRHYDPDTARYTTLDPLGLSPAPNPSAYVVNPSVWADPLGLAPKRCQLDGYDWEGSVRYGRLDSMGRPTGVYSCIRPEMLNTGTEAGRVRPPGWRGDGNAFNEARGHLYANRLGGHGTGRNAHQNLVTETQTPTNTPEQRLSVEDVIFRQVNGPLDEIVQYNVVPKYHGSNPVPHEIHFTAHGNKGFTFSYILENPAAYPRTGV